MEQYALCLGRPVVPCLRWWSQREGHVGHFIHALSGRILTSPTVASLWTCIIYIRVSVVSTIGKLALKSQRKKERFMRLSITDKDLMNRQPVESVDGLQLLGETHGLHRVDASVAVEVQVQARRHDLDVVREDLGVRFEVIETPVLGNFPSCKRLEGMPCFVDCSVWYSDIWSARCRISRHWRYVK